MRRWWALGALGWTLSCACGARSPLSLPDAAVDAAADDRSMSNDLVDASCASGSISLQRRDSRALLVIDRSGSMELDLLGANGVPRRWDVMRAVLPDALAAVDPRVSLGAMMFPLAGGLECAAPTALDVPFGAPRAAEISRALDASRPAGRTPTYAALVQAERLLLGPGGEGARAVILATDGGPNCNGALDGDRCVCSTGAMSAGQDECRMDSSLCLDDARAVAQVSAMASRGVATFVIGIDGDRRPTLVSALTRLARAGGRPNPDPTRAYYSVQRPEDLREAVEGVGRTISSCVLLAAYRPPDEARVIVRLGGVEIPSDSSRSEGWAWAAPGRSELALYGRACAAVSAGAEPSLEVRCAPR